MNNDVLAIDKPWSHMFSTGLTKGIYQSFLRSHQWNRSELDVSPFIYVDPDNFQVKFLTNLMSTTEIGAEEIFALSVESGGSVEVLSTEE